MKCCAFDIDGVLNNYPDCWIDFVNLKIGSSFSDLNEMKAFLTYAKYKKLKDEYRTSGYKIKLPVLEGAAELLCALRDVDYKIILITARPMHKYPDLWIQTKLWLEFNNLPYDVLFHSENKHIEIVTKFPEVEFVVEDNRANANCISRFGYKVFLIDSKYNQGETGDLVFRIKNLKTLKKLRGIQICQ